MSHRRARQLPLSWWPALLIAALPSACAMGVQQELTEDGEPSGGSGGALIVGGKGGNPTVVPKGGSSSGSGGSPISSPFGGSSSSGGKAGDSGGGMSGGDAGSASGGSGGSAAGSGGGGSGGGSAGTGGGGSGPCGCAKTVAWVDDTNISFTTGDCMTVGAATYKYVGVRPQTWANRDCNPTAQLAWCSDVGADYKFMVCP